MIPSGHFLIIKVNFINTLKDLLQEKRADNFRILCGKEIFKDSTPQSILNLIFKHDIIDQKAERLNSESRQLRLHMSLMGRWVCNLGLFDSGYCFPWWLSGKESTCNAGDSGSIPGEGNDNLLQYSYLENPMDKGAWRATVLGVAKSQT